MMISGPINVSYYHKYLSNRVKMNANKSLISFGPKYLLKVPRYTVKNVIIDLDILLKSSFKMQEP